MNEIKPSAFSNGKSKFALSKETVHVVKAADEVKTPPPTTYCPEPKEIRAPPPTGYCPQR